MLRPICIITWLIFIMPAETTSIIFLNTLYPAPSSHLAQRRCMLNKCVLKEQRSELNENTALQWQASWHWCVCYVTAPEWHTFTCKSPSLNLGSCGSVSHYCIQFIESERLITRVKVAGNYLPDWLFLFNDQPICNSIRSLNKQDSIPDMRNGKTFY